MTQHGDGQGVFAPIPDVSESGPCPECVQGKHGNCDGTAWDRATDQPAPCPCAGRAHTAPRDGSTYHRHPLTHRDVRVT